MYKIADIEKNYISMYDKRNDNIVFFFNIVGVDRKYIDDSFTHAFGIHRCGHHEYEFKLSFDECLNEYGDNVSHSETFIEFITNEAETLMNEYNEDQDSELFNRLYF